MRRHASMAMGYGALLTLAAAWLSTPARALEVPTRDVLISLGQAGQVAGDDADRSPIEGRYTYVFPGAKVVPLAGQPLPGRLLVQTDNGLLVYVDEARLSPPAGLRGTLPPDAQIAFITQPTSLQVSLEGREWPVRLEPRQHYRALGEVTGKVRVQIGLCRADPAAPPRACPTEDAERIATVAIPARHAGTLSLAAFAAPTIAFTAPMIPLRAGDLVGIAKGCHEETVRTVSASAGAKIDLSAFFATLALGGEAETSFVQKFGPDMQVQVSYFSRDDGKARRLTTTGKCEGSPDLRFYLPKKATAQNDMEIVADPEMWKAIGVETEPLTGQPKLLCTQHYWALLTALIRAGADERDAAFYMTLMATMPSFDEDSCSDDEGSVVETIAAASDR